MPLGIVSDEIFESEVSKSEKIDKSDSIARIADKNSPGRSNGDKNVPDPLRRIIGEENLVNGRASAIELANSFGISHDSADAYKNGSTSLANYNQPNPSLVSHLSKVKENITNKASNRLLEALDSITTDKLADVKPTDASSIAKDMSVIIRNMEPDKGSDQPRIGPNFVFYSPKRREESDFEIIDCSNE